MQTSICRDQHFPRDFRPATVISPAKPMTKFGASGTPCAHRLLSECHKHGFSLSRPGHRQVAGLGGVLKRKSFLSNRPIAGRVHAEDFQHGCPPGQRLARTRPGRSTGWRQLRRFPGAGARQRAIGTASLGRTKRLRLLVEESKPLFQWSYL